MWLLHTEKVVENTREKNSIIFNERKKLGIIFPPNIYDIIYVAPAIDYTWLLLFFDCFMVIAVAKIAMNTMFYGWNSLNTTMGLVDTRHLLNDRHAAAEAAIRFGWNDVWTIWLNYLNCKCLTAHLMAGPIPFQWNCV